MVSLFIEKNCGRAENTRQLWFAEREALPIGWLIVITVILTGAVAWVLKRYYIDGRFALGG